MPGGSVTEPRRLALFGKLPAHGDFVRRGDPALVRRLDEWLTLEVERLARGRGDALDGLLSGLPVWGFVLPDGLVGALSASHDRVGRVFPLVCCASGGRGIAGDAAALLARAGAEMLDADALAAGLDAAGDDDREDPDQPDVPRWWRPLAEPPHDLAIVGLPVGADFDRLFDGPDVQDDA